MKKLISLILSCVLISAIIFTGCGQSAAPASNTPEEKPAAASAASAASEAASAAASEATSTAASAASEAASETASAAASSAAEITGDFEPRTFTIATCYAEVELGYKYFKWFADYVTEHTGGAAQFDIYPGGTLAKSVEEVYLVQDGGADFTAPRPLEYETLMPFVNAVSTAMGSDVREAVEILDYFLYEDPVTSASIKAESERNNYVMLGSCMPAGIALFVSTKPFTTIDDFKDGKSMFGGGKAYYDLLGIAHTNMTPGEGYEALQRGVIDGFDMNINAITALKWYEVAKYMAPDGCAGSASPIICNLDTWNSLSEDYHQVMREGQLYATEQTIKLVEDEQERQLKELTDNGVTLIDLPQEDKDAFKEAYFVSDVMGSRARAAEQGFSDEMEKVIAAVADHYGLPVPE